MEKPSWCLAVMTRYFMPASLASPTKALASNFGGIELVHVFRLVVGDRNPGLVHHPFGAVGRHLALVFPAGHRIDAPVDKHPETCGVPPLHPCRMLLGRFFRIRPVESVSAAKSTLHNNVHSTPQHAKPILRLAAIFMTSKLCSFRLTKGPSRPMAIH